MTDERLQELIETKQGVDSAYKLRIQENSYEQIGEARERRAEVNKKIVDFLHLETPEITEPEVRSEQEMFDEILSWIDSKKETENN